VFEYMNGERGGARLCVLLWGKLLRVGTFISVHTCGGVIHTRARAHYRMQRTLYEPATKIKT
jgi:hypothetical protein